MCRVKHRGRRCRSAEERPHIRQSGANPTMGNSHIQPKTSVKDFDLALIQWETRLDASLLSRYANVISPWLAGLLLDGRRYVWNVLVTDVGTIGASKLLSGGVDRLQQTIFGLFCNTRHELPPSRRVSNLAKARTTGLAPLRF